MNLDLTPHSPPTHLSPHLRRNLETQFYVQGLAKFSQSDMVKAGLSYHHAQIIVETFGVIAGDENAHIQALTGAITALGGQVNNKCGFDFTAALNDPFSERKASSITSHRPIADHVLFVQLSWPLREPLNRSAFRLTLEVPH